MATKFFGQFLLERRVVTRESLLDAMRYQETIHKPLCALAVEQGFLSREQLQELDGDARESDKRFLEMAVNKKMLTFQQLEELGKMHTDRWVFLGQALVDRGHLSLVQLDQLIEAYRKEAQPRGEPSRVALDGIPERAVITSLMDITIDLFVQYTKEIVQVKSVERITTKLEGIAYVFSQEVVGDKNFLYALALPEELMLSIASYILQEEVTEGTELALDAVSEFVNIIIGHGCTQLCMDDHRVAARAPQIMTGEMMASLLPADVIAVQMCAAKGDFRVLFFFSEQSPVHQRADALAV